MSAPIVLPTHVFFKNLTGQTFGRLAVLSYQGRAGAKKISMWLCRCACGKEKVIAATSLHRGTASCGCLHLDMMRATKATHGKSKSPEYHIWTGMIDRCENPNGTAFEHYGGRGISICERWRHSFEAFLADMGPRPTAKHEIDRYPNNDGNYEPTNCRWVERVRNARNKRSNRVIEFQGERHCISEWAEITGLPRHTIQKRIDCGWSIERAMTTPKRNWNH